MITLLISLYYNFNSNVPEETLSVLSLDKIEERIIKIKQALIFFRIAFLKIK